MYIVSQNSFPLLKNVLLSLIFVSESGILTPRGSARVLVSRAPDIQMEQLSIEMASQLRWGAKSQVLVPQMLGSTERHVAIEIETTSLTWAVPYALLPKLLDLVEDASSGERGVCCHIHAALVMLIPCMLDKESGHIAIEIKIDLLR